MLDTSDNQEVELPMVVLMNANTSYAAPSCLAESIREFEKGKRGGHPHGGQGHHSVRRPSPCQTARPWRITVGMLLDKTANSFDGTGVTPDVEVASDSRGRGATSTSITVETDPQITKAFEAVSLLLRHPDQTAVRRGQRFVQRTAPASSRPAAAEPA